METTKTKMRTLKDLKNHPLVCEIEKEYNPGIFDGYDYTYWLYLKDGYWFEEEQIGCIHEPRIKDILSLFNSFTITKRTDGF